MKKSLIVLIVFLMSLTVFAGGKKDTSSTDGSLKYIKDKGVLVLGLDDSFPPMGFRDDQGQITGFDIDLAKEVTRRMGVELKLQPIDWDAKILDLNSRDIDVIWNGLTITDERKESIGFSRAYIANRQIIIVRAGSGISVKSDLAGKSIGLQLGSSADEAVASDKATAASLGEIIKYQDNIQALMDLAAGSIDAVVVDEILGRYYIAKKTGVYSVAADSFAEEEYGVGFRKGETAFINEVDRILGEMASDGTAAAISTKWFGENVILF